MATVKEFTRIGLPPQRHAYDDPSLTALEFLLAVMHDARLPLSTRLEAARAALPYTSPFPSKVQGYVSFHCRIVIPPFEPGTPDHPPATDPTRNHSENPDFASKTLTHSDEAQALQNTEKTTEPSPFIDFSLPPDPAVFEAALKYGYPAPHLCSFCKHWLTVTYPDCICADPSSHDPSKLN
jgi:hypothetical protein